MSNTASLKKEYADRIAMLHEGKIVATGTVEEIKNSSNPVVQAFINGQELKKEEQQWAAVK